MQAPIFLISSERSGSNLITRLFNAHSAICGPSPSHLLRVLGWNVARFGDLSIDKNWDFLIKTTCELFENKLGSWKTAWSVQKLTEACAERSFAAIFSAIYMAEAQAHSKSRVFIKENQMASLFTFASGAWPDAKFVLLTRDPRDVAASWKNTPAKVGGVEKAVDVWMTDQQDNLRLLNQLHGLSLNSEQVPIFFTRYEDLVQSPEVALSQVCQWLGIEFEAGMLKFNQASAAKADSKKIAAWSNLNQPLMSQNTSKYRDQLSEHEIKYIEAKCFRQMRDLGYALDFQVGDPDEYVGFVRKTKAEEAAGNQQVSESELKLRSKRRELIFEILSQPIISNRVRVDV